MDVVVTGIGSVSACGIGAAALWDGILAGKPLAAEVPRLARDGEAPPLACEVPGFDPAAMLGPRGLRLLDRATLLTLVATHLALEDAGLLPHAPAWSGMRAPGLVVGTSFGSVASISSYIGERLARGPTALNPSLFPNTVVNSPASQAAIRFGFTTLCTTLSTGWASGAEAIGYAADALRRGRAERILAGGVEELTAENLAVYRDLGLLPGLTLAEGACLLVLERADAAAKRGARPLARLTGRGTGFAPLAHGGLPGAIAEALAPRMRRQPLGPEAPATSRHPEGGNPGARHPELGLPEAGMALDLLVAGHPKSAILPGVYSRHALFPGAILGEADGAGGALGAAIAVMALARGQVPGYNSEVGSALVTASSYSGHAAALVFERVAP